MAAAAPGAVAPHSPVNPGLFEPLMPPSASHPMGTDLRGRDVFSRVVHGARIAVISALGAVAISLLLGRAIAILAQHAHSGRRQLLTRVVDLMQIVPSAATALMLAYLLGPGVTQGVMAVGVSLAPALASVWTRPPEAAGDHGDPGREVPPVALISAITIQALGTAILSLTAIDFIGLGWAAPAPAWGVLLGQGHGALADAWWLTVFPGSLVLAVVLATMAVGDALLQAERDRGPLGPAAP